MSTSSGKPCVLGNNNNILHFQSTYHCSISNCFTNVNYPKCTLSWEAGIITSNYSLV